MITVESRSQMSVCCCESVFLAFREKNKTKQKQVMATEAGLSFPSHPDDQQVAPDIMTAPSFSSVAQDNMVHL